MVPRTAQGVYELIWRTFPNMDPRHRYWLQLVSKYESNWTHGWTRRIGELNSDTSNPYNWGALIAAPGRPFFLYEDSSPKLVNGRQIQDVSARKFARYSTPEAGLQAYAATLLKQNVRDAVVHSSRLEDAVGAMWDNCYFEGLVGSPVPCTDGKPSRLRQASPWKAANVKTYADKLRPLIPEIISQYRSGQPTIKSSMKLPTWWAFKSPTGVVKTGWHPLGHSLTEEETLDIPYQDPSVLAFTTFKDANWTPWTYVIPPVNV